VARHASQYPRRGDGTASTFPHPALQGLVRSTTVSLRLTAARRAFSLERRRCGELDVGVEGERVWMTWYVWGAD
jgi:hypothetical protein